MLGWWYSAVIVMLVVAVVYAPLPKLGRWIWTVGVSEVHAECRQGQVTDHDVGRILLGADSALYVDLKRGLDECVGHR